MCTKRESAVRCSASRMKGELRTKHLRGELTSALVRTCVLTTAPAMGGGSLPPIGAVAAACLFFLAGRGGVSGVIVGDFFFPSFLFAPYFPPHRPYADIWVIVCFHHGWNQAQP